MRSVLARRLRSLGVAPNRKHSGVSEVAPNAGRRASGTRLGASPNTTTAVVEYGHATWETLAEAGHHR